MTFKSALMVSSNGFTLVNMQQEGRVKDLLQPAAQHHPQYVSDWDVREFPSLSAVFQIICFDCVRMLSIHQHLYAVSCNSHLLFFFNEHLFTGAFSGEFAWRAEPTHIAAASNTIRGEESSSETNQEYIM